jgi:hypothetical protein
MARGSQADRSAIELKSHASQTSAAAGRNKEHPMLDILMLALAAGLFAAGIGYAYACERL